MKRHIRPPARIREEAASEVVGRLFPHAGRVLLTGGGRQFVERLGVGAIREVIANVMVGQNLRTQTEPLSRRRIGQVSGALITLLTRGYTEVSDFGTNMSRLATRQLETAPPSDNALVWPAQWLIGLTGKGVQNVLRDDRHAFTQYVEDFEAAIYDVAERCRESFGDCRMTLGFVEDEEGRRAELDWHDIARLTTAIGSQTLTIRGSDKSIYGKLFERLVLGSLLSMLGFERVDPALNVLDRGVFWLSDSSAERECDATLLYEPGRVVRFDIGFIGRGNSEISKDKLSRFSRELEFGGSSGTSFTYIIVDKLPETSKTLSAAIHIEAELTQMSMQCWPREVAQKLHKRLGFEHPLMYMSDLEVGELIRDRLATMPVQEFVGGVSVAELDEPGT